MKLHTHTMAAFYNDARVNIFYCLNDIRERMGMKPVGGDEHIRVAFSELSLRTAEPERQRELIKLLRNRFPFLDVLTERTNNQKNQDKATPLPAYYDSILSRMFNRIHVLRNIMVHPTDPEPTIEHREHRNLYFDLINTYDTSRNIIKERFKLSADTMKPLLRCGNKGKPRQVTQFSLAICIDFEKTKKNKNITLSHVLYDFGQVLLCSLFLDKSQGAELFSHFLLAGYEKDWTSDQKNWIKELAGVYRIRLPIKRIHSTDTKHAITLDTLSELSRCPRLLFDALGPKDQERFRTQLSPAAMDEGESETPLLIRSRWDRFVLLLLRFLDLDASCKLRFGIDLGRFYYSVRLKPSTSFTDKRSKVRRLGKRIVAYGRLSDFTEESKPELWQELEANCNNSSDEINEKKSGPAKNTIQQLRPYIVRTIPRYHLYDDKIGFRLVNRDSDRATYPVWRKKDVESNKCFNNISGRAMQPHFWASPPQMVSIGFYIYLQSRLSGFLSFDVLLKKYRSGYVKLLKAVANGEIPDLAAQKATAEKKETLQQWVNTLFNNNQGKQFSVLLSDLPKVVVNHLLANTSTSNTRNRSIKRATMMLEKTERMQQQIDDLLKGFKKRGKKGFRPIKCGHIADFLIDDILRFQPVDSSKPDGGKLNSQQYQILQAALAYYGAHIDEPPKISDLLEDAGLLYGEYAHPFLHCLQQPPDKYSGLISFYKDYLVAKRRYLEKFIYEFEKTATESTPPRWLRLKQNSTLEQWLQEQIDDKGNLLHPLPVPQNMLYKPILSMVAHSCNLEVKVLYKEGEQAFVRNGKNVKVRPALSWLLKRYLQTQKDRPQKMYHYKRSHDLFDVYLDTRKNIYQEKQHFYLQEQKRKEQLPFIRKAINRPPSHPDPHKLNKKEVKKVEEEEKRKTKLKKLLKAYKRREKRLLHSSVQDILLYLYAKHYLDHDILDLGNAAPSWNLHGQEHTLLNTPIYYELPISKTDQYLFHPECKIRNLGELRLLVRDKRLPGLLQYYPSQEKKINQQEIRAELADYRRAKVKAMKLVHKLEQRIVHCLGQVPERDTITKKKTKDIFGTARHGDFLYTLAANFRKQEHCRDSLADEHINRARLIRNGFSHNVYPEAKKLPEIAAQLRSEDIPLENPARNRKIAEKIYLELDKLYRPWFAFLKN